MSLSLAEFNRLVSEHGAAMYRLAYRLLGDRHEAEDVVQETFRSAWSSGHSYDPNRGGRAWLAAILRRRVIDCHRRLSRMHDTPLLPKDEPLVETDFTELDPFSDEMQQALGRLSSELRETLLLVVVGELTHQEAADVLNVPLGTVLSRVSRARQQLRQHWLAIVEEEAGENR